MDQNLSEGKVDLNQLLPEQFLEIPYKLNGDPNQKVKIMQDFENNLEQMIQNTQKIDIDKNKDYSQIIKIISLLVEESNSLVCNEAIKILKLLVFIINQKFPAAKLKHFVIVLTQKFNLCKKDVVNKQNNLIFQALEEIVLAESLSVDSFLEILFNQIENNQNLATVLGCLDWLQQNFVPVILNMDLRSIQEIRPKTAEKIDKTTFSKKLLQSKKNRSPDVNVEVKSCGKLRILESLNQKLTIILNKKQKIQKNLQIRKGIQDLLRDLELRIQNEQDEDVQENHDDDHIPDNDKENNCDNEQDKSLISTSQKIYFIANENPSTQNIDQLQQLQNLQNQLLSQQQYQQQYLLQQNQDQINLQHNLTINNYVNQEVELNLNNNDSVNQVQQFLNEIESLKKISGVTNQLVFQNKIENILGLIETVFSDNQILLYNQEVITKKCTKVSKKIIQKLMSDNKNHISIEKTMEFMYAFFMKINDSIQSLTENCLYHQLKYLVIRFPAYQIVKKVLKVIESHNIVGLDEYLRAVIRLFQKFDQQTIEDSINNQQFFNFIEQKIEKAQHFNEQFFSFYDQKLRSLDLKKKLSQHYCKQLIEAIQRKNFNQKLKDNKSYQFSDDEESHIHDSVKPSMNVTELGEVNFEEDFEKALCNFKQYIQTLKEQKSIYESSIQNSPKVWKRGQGRDSKNIKSYNIDMGFIKKNYEMMCENYQYNQIDSLLQFSIDILDSLSQPQQDSVIYIIFTSLTVRNFFDQPKQYEKLHSFLCSILNSINKQNVLYPSYKQAFNYCHKHLNNSQYCFNLIKNVFKFIFTEVMQENLQLKYLVFFVESIVFCLTEKELQILGNELMKDLHSQNDAKDLQRIFENELIYSLHDYQIYLNWCKKNIVIEEEKIEPPSHLIQLNQTLRNDQDICQKVDSTIKGKKSTEASGILDDQTNTNSKEQFFMEQVENNKVIQNNQDNSIKKVKKDDETLNFDTKSIKKFESDDIKFPPLYEKTTRKNSDHDSYIQYLKQKLQSGDAKKSQYDFENEHQIQEIDELKLSHIKNSQAYNWFMQSEDFKSCQKRFNFMPESSKNKNDDELMNEFQLKDNFDHQTIKEDSNDLDQIKLKESNPSKNPQISQEVLKSQLFMLEEFQQKAIENESKFIRECEKNTKLLEDLQNLNYQYLANCTENHIIKTELAQQQEQNQLQSNENKKLMNDLKQANILISELKEQLNEKQISQQQLEDSLEKSLLFNYQEAFSQNEKPSSQQIFYLQEIFMTSDILHNDISQIIIEHYESLKQILEKMNFLNDLKSAILNQFFLEHINEQSHQKVLQIILILCTSDSTQNQLDLDASRELNQENYLTEILQIILDSLLRCKSPNVVLLNLIKILSNQLPKNFHKEFLRNQRLLFRLIIKCIERIEINLSEKELQSLKTYDFLLELYKFMKIHPPESLEDGLPSLKEIEYIYRYLKKFSDTLIQSNLAKSKSFLLFIQRQNNQSVWIQYLQNYIEKVSSDYIR